MHEFTAQPELGEPRAEFIRTALLENGIDVWIEGEFPPVRVLVGPADVATARAIIREVESQEDP